MQILKKFGIGCLIGLMLLTAACSNNQPSTDSNNASTTNTQADTKNPSSVVLEISEEDQSVIEQIGDDLHSITDETFIETVSGLNSDPTSYIGSVYELEGVLTHMQVHDSSVPYLYRTVGSGEEATNVGLLLRYLPDELEDGAWLHVYGILALDEHDGHSHAVLDVIAVETPAQMGSVTLEQ